jgi:signal peptidase II
MESVIDPPQPSLLSRVRTAAPLLAVAALAFTLDQLSKLWIVATIGPAQPSQQIVIIPGWFVFQYVENTGAAFGMFRSGGWVLALLALAVVVGMLFMVPRLQREASGPLARGLLLVSLGLVLGGALGNLLDRVLRGFVVDFLLVPAAQVTLGDRLYRWPNFNLADSAISVGIVLLVLNLFFLQNRETKS